VGLQSIAGGDVWAIVFLALVLKLPLAGILAALWMAFRRADSAQAAPVPLESRMALCAYCGTRITVGYDAARLHAEADVLARRTGQAAFDVETRLVREAIQRPDHHAQEPRLCPGCGDEAVWTPIEPVRLETGRVRGVHAG
jgi:hypothetical protein